MSKATSLAPDQSLLGIELSLEVISNITNQIPANSQDRQPIFERIITAAQEQSLLMSEACYINLSDALVPLCEDKNRSLEASGTTPLTATLTSLDTFLRDVWLECCGHESTFSEWDHAKLGKGQKIQRFSNGDKIRHEYDMGSPTDTVITFLTETVRRKQKKAVRVLARNAMPEVKCSECYETATMTCIGCVWDDKEHYYCDDCADVHPDDHLDLLMPLCNSPRSGVCGYWGDQDEYEFDPDYLLAADGSQVKRRRTRREDIEFIVK